MRKELESLSKEKLLEVASQLNIYQAEKLNKKDLINQILRVTGEKTQTATMPVKLKISKTNIKMNIIFACMLIITFSSIIVPIVSRFLFSSFGTSRSSHFIYIMVLNVFSLLWSGYVWRIWIRTGQINPFMIFSLFMTLAYDGYYLWNMYEYMESLSLLKLISNTYLKQYHDVTITFYVWASILGSSILLGGVTFLSLRIK